MNKIFDVLVVGELNVDIILDKIQGFPEIGKEILSKELNVTLGSSSAIFASNISSLGNKVAFIGKIGKDNFANIIKESLENKKVYTDFIIESKKYKTGLTIVMNYDMDRANVTFPGAMEHLLEKEVDQTILSKAKHLHLSSIFLQTGLLKDIVQLFKKAKELTKCDFKTFWLFSTKEATQKIERIVPLIPLSKESRKIKKLMFQLGLYRSAIGQKKQEEILSEEKTMVSISLCPR